MSADDHSSGAGVTGGIADERDDLELIAVMNVGGPEAERAFAALYERHKQWVANLALRFTRDRELAADVTQEVFLYFLRKFPGFELTARLTTFFYPAVKNLAIAHRNKANRYAGDDAAIAAVTPATDGVDPIVADSHTRTELARVFEALSQDHREVVLLRFVDGFSLAEIAETVGVPLGTVKSRLHHALNALREDERTRKYFEA